ncbi:hypothetical protein COCMIDRAFT_2202 [Bipolaris oryzae ATCC 44560]|uniref:Uncharacterized protein n=1 Tax=Bipolaris oryzae ATCC 44560 TaxID=930090 RepID=W6ZAY8_COCMI|nr:uncharacterized protein COCMIDRAFT_2202 [Bipolaris oryzae ATCC 44560]EUC48937.1 hypothetical protein COCMIDRAFT_2202 [Bipolaris oryzae ATCC 44560]
MAYTFPLEVWAEILQHIDDPFTLWVPCRQVARGIRYEAERVFYTTFIPLLHIEWTGAESVFEYTEPNIIATPYLQAADSTWKSSPLTLTLSSTDGYEEVNRDMSYSEWRERAHRAINYADMDLWRADIEHENYHNQVIYFNTPDVRYTFINSAETRFDDANFHAVDGECKPYKARAALDWRQLMTRLFAEENIVRKRLGGCASSFWEYAERLIRTIFRSSERRICIGKGKRRYEYEAFRRRVGVLIEMICWNDFEFHPLYTKALEQRLRCAFDRDGGNAGRLEDVFGDVCEYSRQRGSAMMQIRANRLMDFAQGLWLQRWKDEE